MWGRIGYFVKHVFKVRLGIVPRSNGIAKEHEIICDATWIYAYEMANAAKCRVLFLVVSNQTQCCAPWTHQQQRYFNSISRWPPTHYYCCISSAYQTCMNDCRYGAICMGHTRPSRPIVIAVFSSKVFGVFGLFMMSIRLFIMMLTNWLVSGPYCTAISPMAHIALLHTDIKSGFKLALSICMKLSFKKNTGPLE